MIGLVKTVGYAIETGVYVAIGAGFGTAAGFKSTSELTESVQKFAESLFSQISVLDAEKIAAYGKNYTNIENIAGLIKANELELVQAMLYIGTAYCAYRAACSALCAVGSLVGIV